MEAPHAGVHLNGEGDHDVQHDGHSADVEANEEPPRVLAPCHVHVGLHDHVPVADHHQREESHERAPEVVEVQFDVQVGNGLVFKQFGRV